MAVTVRGSGGGLVVAGGAELHGGKRRRAVGRLDAGRGRLAVERRAVARDAAGKDHRFSALVMAIVNSEPFQMRVKKAEEAR